MAQEPFLGAIQPFGFSFNPVGWLPCDGRTVPISEYDALFTLIGTTYGGDGVSTFALPDLRGRVPISMGTGIGLTTRIIGQKSGHEMVQLTTGQMPLHTHPLNAQGGTFMVSGANGVSETPSTVNNTIAAAVDPNPGGSTNNAYNNLAPDITLNTGSTGGSATVSPTGGGQPFENMEPYQVINYCIAVQGIYPTRS